MRVIITEHADFSALSREFTCSCFFSFTRCRPQTFALGIPSYSRLRLELLLYILLRTEPVFVVWIREIDLYQYQARSASPTFPLSPEALHAKKTSIYLRYKLLVPTSHIRGHPLVSRNRNCKPPRIFKPTSSSYIPRSPS